MMLLSFSVFVCVGSLTAFGVETEPAQNSPAKIPAKPNIVILLADDMGWGELGCYGQEVIKTPNLDTLASKGLRFTDFYAGCAVCSPSRAVLMTGIPVGRLSIRGNKGLHEDGKWDRIALKKSEVTVPEMLNGAGYQTAFIGKWHLGIPQDVSTWATGRGFDFAVQEQWGPKADGGVFDERDHWVNGCQESVFHDYTKIDCLDEFRTDIALKFLDQKRDQEKPLFLFMSYRSPHAHEFFLREKDRYKEHGWPEIERRHASRITMLDEQIQRLLDKLEAMGEMDNTFVLFTSDNGPHAEGPAGGDKHDPLFFISSNGLKGHKRDLYEGGVRVPGIAYWKGKIRAGETSEHQAIFYDVMPTLAEIAGVDPPDQTGGISFLPELIGKEQKTHDHLYWEIMEGRAAKAFRQATRMGHWKAVRYGAAGVTELYNLETDLYETKDVAASYPEIVEKMNKILRSESKKDPHFPYSGDGP
ncbi:sulfatase-like hydrolase/transferase [Novipirellula herctigrandis]